MIIGYGKYSVLIAHPKMFFKLSAGRILSWGLSLVICISLTKLLLCLWHNGPRYDSEVSQQEVYAWLDNLGLGEHKDLFREHGELITILLSR